VEFSNLAHCELAVFCFMLVWFVLCDALLSANQIMVQSVSGITAWRQIPCIASSRFKEVLLLLRAWGSVVVKALRY
jgi:hypothetical protein